MDTILIKCFICNTHCIAKDICTGSNLARALTMAISAVLEKCLQQSIAEPENEFFCKDCTRKIKEYVQFVRLSQQIEYELFELFQRKSIESYYLVEEVDDEVDDGELPLINETKQILENKHQNQGEDNDTEQEFVWSMVEDEKAENDIDDSKFDMVIEYLEPDDLDEVKTPPSRPLIDATKTSKKSSRLAKKGKSEHKNKHAPKKSFSTKIKKEKQSPKSNLNCKKCNSSFEILNDLKEHRKTHAVKLQFFCDICGQSYKSKAALTVHIGLHKGKSPHECEICGKKFTQRGALVRHMPMHTGEKPYQCDKCGKRFMHYSSFHMHGMVHTNERSKKCNICGLELRSNSHLNRHLRVHSGEKPYECPECGQKFAQRYNMTTHFNTHKGIHRVHHKNHKCPVCNEAFVRREKLNAHLQNQHNMSRTDVTRNTKQPAENILISKQYKDNDGETTIFINLIKEEENIIDSNRGSLETIIDVKLSSEDPLLV